MASVQAFEFHADGSTFVRSYPRRETERARSFIRALAEHYGTLPFSYAAIQNNYNLRRIAPPNAEELLRRVGTLYGVDGSGRDLYRLPPIRVGAIATLEKVSGEAIEMLRSWTRAKQGVRRRRLDDAIAVACEHHKASAVSEALDRSSGFASGRLRSAVPSSRPVDTGDSSARNARTDDHGVTYREGS